MVFGCDRAMHSLRLSMGSGKLGSVTMMRCARPTVPRGFGCFASGECGDYSLSGIFCRESSTSCLIQQQLVGE